MSQPPAVLLLDDGELDAVADLMKRSGIAFERARGGGVPDDLGAPDTLLITTPRHAGKVRRGAPAGARPGRPVRIIAVEEDSPSMRRMLRNMGFQMLVRQPAHSEVWRLLIQRALYQGEERRRELRLPIGSEVALDADAAGSGHALLVDISNRGCHLVTGRALGVESHIRFLLERGDSEEPIDVSGQVVRSKPWTRQGDEVLFSSAVLFDDGLGDQARMQLTQLINSRVTGAPMVSASAAATPLPSAESPVLPGLRLDDETDPPVPTDLEVDYRIDSESDRRQDTRAGFSQSVVVMGESHAHILIGRDLSAGGMRVESLPGIEIGDRLRLALHGPSESEPIEVHAEVVRDDGEEGIGLRFRNLPTVVSDALEKMVACLPAVESLEDEEADGVATILSEVLPD